MANEVRGEFAIMLDGAEHFMRPSWEAILAFETALGKGLIALAGSAASMQLTTREMATIVGECVRAYGREKDDRSHMGVNDAAVTRCLVDLGPLNAMKPVQNMLLKAATGGVTSSGELKADPEEAADRTTDPKAATTD